MTATRHTPMARRFSPPPQDGRFSDPQDHNLSKSLKPKLSLQPLRRGGAYGQHASVMVSEKHALDIGWLDLEKTFTMRAEGAPVKRPTPNQPAPPAAHESNSRFEPQNRPEPQNPFSHIPASKRFSCAQEEPMPRDPSIPLEEDHNQFHDQVREQFHDQDHDQAHDQDQRMSSARSNDDGSAPALPQSTWSVFGQSRLFWNQSLTLFLYITALCLGISMLVSLLVPSLTILRQPLFMILVACALCLPWTWHGLSATSIAAAITLAAFVLAMVGVFPIFAALPGLAAAALVFMILAVGGPKPAADLSPAGKVIRLPGPAQRQGRLLSLGKLLLSQLASMLNPWQLAQTGRQFVGLVSTWGNYRGEFPNVDTYEQQTKYYLPVQGCWLVAHGSVQLDPTRPQSLWNQRYAYELLMINDQGGSHRGEGSDRTDYFCYGEPVIAPAAGEIVEVRSDIPEHVCPGTLMQDWLAKDMRGNYCVIRHSEGEYSFLSHFIPGTLRVQAGQMVQPGDVLGHCGQSGHASEPLLHFRVQDHQDFFQAVGLPVAFAAVAVDDNVKQTAYLQQGQMVESTWVSPEGR